MSLRNVNSACKVQQVACLACNSKVAISFAKDIYKTAFAQTAETLAFLVTTTLSLDAMDNLQSSYLCVQCLNYFGKLYLAQRKVKSITSEILKIYQGSLNVKENRINGTTIPNATRLQDAPICSLQVPTTCCKPKAVIRQIVNISTKRKRQNTSNLVATAPLHNDLCTKFSHAVHVQQSVAEQSSFISDNSNHSFSQSNEERIVNLDASLIHNNNEQDFSGPNSISNSSSSLRDHQYSLQSAKAKPRKLDASSKILSVLHLQNEISTTSSSVVKTVQESKKKIKIAKPKYHVCPHCNKKERTLKDFRQHLQKTHSEFYSYTCEKCGVVYKSQKALEIHVNLHNGINPLTCLICSKSFTQKSALKRHEHVHTREEPYQRGNICSKIFTHCTTYNMDTLSHNQEKMHKCKQCPIAFTSPWRLKRHMRIHTGDKQHTCGMCNKRFYDRCSVVSHMKVHDPERIRLKEIRMKEKRHIQRRCERCNINFDSLGKYTVHLHSHTPKNVLPYCKVNYARSIN